jgi:hypothetical protein
MGRRQKGGGHTSGYLIFIFFLNLCLFSCGAVPYGRELQAVCIYCSPSFEKEMGLSQLLEYRVASLEADVWVSA